MKNNHLKIIGVLMLLLLAASGVQSRHIIGGEITYTCSGNNNYDFEMNIYRDCFCSDCAPLDAPAVIAVYRCGDGTSCNLMTQGTPFMTLNAALLSVSNVDPPDFPCLVLPPDICVEEGIYRFSMNLPPVGEDSYHIVYQRCCRNVTISNINDPEDSGATYSVEINPLSQSLCNSSPVFNEFPPTVICAGEPLNFDHSASDPDGDQLVYEFCSPLLGGGPVGTTDNPGNADLCDGVSPNPPCPPPFRRVDFILSNYNAVEPMAGDPVVKIDPNTGLITGTPTMQGQFVVGVCVSEYRGGQLLGSIRRDFQFNVEPCEPTVIAAIASDERMGARDFLINSCGNETISFVNESFQRNFIDEFNWTFDIAGVPQSYPQWSPTVTFPGVGTYEGQLVLNPGTQCGDTANIFVNIYPEINAEYSFAYDTCTAGPTTFTDESFSGSGQIRSWNWDFSDGTTSESQNPSHDFRVPGELPVTLTVVDVNECVGQETKVLPYFPVPALLIIAPSSFEGCQPAEIFFDNLSIPIDETYDIVWDFGDGTTGGDVSPTHIYDEPGVFTVSLDVTSPIGCQTDTVFPALIKIDPSPISDFTFSPEQPSNLIPTVQFTEQASGAVSWFWEFGELGTSREKNPAFTFPDTGMHEVRLIVTHPSGCVDTFSQILDVIPEVRYFLPNAFTPNDDGSNDVFRGTGDLRGAEDFYFSIWNRWGELVFETTDPEEAWNGKKFNTGKISPNGVYVVLVKYTGPRGEKVKLNGYATLIK